MITTIQYGKVKTVAPNEVTMYDRCIDALIVGGMWYAIYILENTDTMVAVYEGNADATIVDITEH